MDMAGPKIVSSNKHKQSQKLMKCFYKWVFSNQSNHNSDSHARIEYHVARNTLMSQKGCFIGLLAFKIRQFYIQTKWENNMRSD